MGSTRHHGHTAALRLALLFLLGGCAAAPIRSQEAQPGQVRGVKVGDVLPETLEPLVVKRWAAPAYTLPFTHKAVYGEGVDLAKADAFVLHTESVTPILLVVAPRESTGKRRVRLLAQGAVPAGVTPGELLGVTKGGHQALHRTATPGVFVLMRKTQFGEPEPEALFHGPEDLVTSGLLEPLLPPDHADALLLGGLEMTLARAEREGWGIVKLAPTLGLLSFNAQYGGGLAMKKCKALNPLAERKYEEWKRELADLDAATLGPLQTLLWESFCLQVPGKEPLWKAARALHLEELLLSGRWLTAAGEARVIRAPLRYATGLDSVVHTPTPTAEDLFLRAPALLPQMVDTTAPEADLRYRGISFHIPAFDIATARAAGGTLELAVEEQVVDLAGSFVRKGTRTEAKFNSARLQYEENRAVLQAQATRAAKEAEANRDFARLEERGEMRKRRVTYVNKFGEEVRETIEEHEVAVAYVRVDELKKDRFERAAKAYDAAAERLKQLGPGPAVELETYDFGTQRWSGKLRWTVRVSGAFEQELQLEADAAKVLGSREGQAGKTEHALVDLRNHLRDEAVTQLAPALRRLARARIDKHLAALKDPQARAQEAAWARLWLGEPALPEDGALGVPVEPEARKRVSHRR